jgi:hypothetical protein
VRADGVYTLTNPSFASGLAGWQQWSSQGRGPFDVSNGPLGGTPSLHADLAAGVSGSLWQELAVSSGQGSPQVGDKLELGARLWLGAGSGSGALWIEVLALGDFGAQAIARSAELQVASAPQGRWLWLATAPLASFGGRVPSGTTGLRLLVHLEVSGPLWIDALQCGKFEYGEWSLVGNDFEGGKLAAAWQTSGEVTVSTPGLQPYAYRGQGFLRLGGSSGASAFQAVPVAGWSGTPAHGRVPEACAWAYVTGGAALPASPSASHEVELCVRAWEQGTPLASAVLLARARWRPVVGEALSWTFLQTEPLAAAALPLDRSHVLVEVKKNFAGIVRVDFVQLGERFGVDGNPKRHATAHYVGHFRSPHAKEAVSAPPASSEIWRTWSWTAPPACDGNFTAFAHEPECTASPACFRVNGRRDGATSVQASLDSLPLAGAYDSRDRDVLRYHVRAAQAIGLDSFTYLHQGHTLATQTAGFGLEPLNSETYEALLDVAEEPGINFKVALMYEPKVHFNGWVQGEPSLDDKLAGIAADLVHLVDSYYLRKAALKRDGRLVVFVFRNDVCDGSGQQCLSDAHWLAIRQQVESATGRELFLVADVPPAADSAFDGLSRWDLVALPLLRFRTWSQVAAGIPAMPAPDGASASAHGNLVNQAAREWALQDDAQRLAVAIAWPAFDDSGVAGWGAQNGLGSDGAPLCVRIAPDLGGDFFEATLAAARASDADWIQIATWNDWNEGTQIEPRWNREWSQAALDGAPAPAASVQAVFDRAFRLRNWLAGFKLGVHPLGKFALEGVAADYLRRAHGDAAVVEYD